MAIVLKIDNPDFEKQLLGFVKQQKQGLEELTIEALTNFIDSFQNKKKLLYQKKDPTKHSRIIEYKDSSDEDLSDVKPYAHIEDSGKYIHDLRRKREH